MQWLKLGVVFLIFAAASHAQLDQCVRYDECPEIDCVGYIRECIGGECRYSDCLLSFQEGYREDVPSFKNTLKEYHVETENTFGLRPILIFSGKIVVIIIVGLLLMFVLSAAGAHGFFKYAALVGILGLAVFGAFFLFSDQLAQLFSASYDPEQPVIRNFTTQRGLVLQQRDITKDALLLDSTITSAKEYRMAGSTEETCLIILDHDGKYSFGQRQGYRLLEKQGIETMEKEEDLHIVDLFSQEDRSYYIAGREDTVKALMSRLIMVRLDSLPVIAGFVPENNSVTNNPVISFSVENAEKIDVSAIGWAGQETDCASIGHKFSCGFTSDFAQGRNEVKITAYSGEKSISRSYAFTFDTIAPAFRDLPANGSYHRFFDFSFSVVDLSGIAEISAVIDGQRIEPACEMDETDARCRMHLDATEGMHALGFYASDNIGNLKKDYRTITYDVTNPEIFVDEGDYVISDNTVVDLDSVMADNRKIAPSLCSGNASSYRCRPGFSVSRISARDLAGNTVMYENKHERP